MCGCLLTVVLCLCITLGADLGVKLGNLDGDRRHTGEVLVIYNSAARLAFTQLTDTLTNKVGSTYINYYR